MPRAHRDPGTGHSAGPGTLPTGEASPKAAADNTLRLWSNVVEGHCLSKNGVNGQPPAVCICPHPPGRV